MKHESVNLQNSIDRLDTPWSPRVVASLNDYQVKVARLEGDFVWHRHTDTDELFLCLDGELEIEFRDGSVKLREGELYVVRRGVEHRPRAQETCHILIIEPAGVVNTGDRPGPLTAPVDKPI